SRGAGASSRRGVGVHAQPSASAIGESQGRITLSIVRCPKGTPWYQQDHVVKGTTQFELSKKTFGSRSPEPGAQAVRYGRCSQEMLDMSTTLFRRKGWWITATATALLHGAACSSSSDSGAGGTKGHGGNAGAQDAMDGSVDGRINADGS